MPRFSPLVAKGAGTGHPDVPAPLQRVTLEQTGDCIPFNATVPSFTVREATEVNQSQCDFV